MKEGPSKYMDILWLYEKERRDFLRTIQNFYETNLDASSTEDIFRELVKFVK